MNFMRMIQPQGSSPNSHRLSTFVQDLRDLELKSKWLYLGIVFQDS